MKSMVTMKTELDFGGIFGLGSKNHDKITTANLRIHEMHFVKGQFQKIEGYLGYKLNNN